MSSRPLIQSLEPRLLLSAVDPYNMGKGDWIWVLSNARNNTGTATNAALFSYLKNKGMKWVIVKAAQSTNDSFKDTTTGAIQMTAQLVTDAHNAGLKIFGYQYVYGADPVGEANAAKSMMARANPDGLIIDAEGEYESLANNAAAATTYCTSIRAAYPNTFMAHAPFPIVSYHSAFPYYTFGKYCDAVMPQAYFGAIKVTPQRMATWEDDEFKSLYANFAATGKSDAIKPIVPISQGWNDSTTNFTSGADILTFISTLMGIANPAGPGGYKGVSFWSVQHHTADMWANIGAATIGNPTFAVGQTVQVNGAGAAGLKAWSNSSSVAPATYTVQPEGAVATIVSGPVFANGFNRWQVRYKGDTVDRWSAEDYLQAAPAPAAPTYSSPANNASSTTPPTSLNWADVAVATSYDVYLDGALKANVTTTSYALANLAAGAHTWQIRSKNSAATTPGPTWNFTDVVPLPASPAFPTPANVSKPKVRPAALDWSDAANATSYDVYLNNVLQGNVSTSQWTFATAVPVKVQQIWRVVAKNAGGSTSGPNWYFTVDPIPGDANADGAVDDADFAILNANLNQPGGWAAGDFSGDGLVGFKDFQIFELNYGNSVIPASAAPAPAPVLRTAVPVTPPFSLTPIARQPLLRPPVRRIFA